MISLIACSVNSERAKAFQKNIERTIGIPHEIIIFDNREKKYGLAKAYNLCASQSRYDYLCFIHEDIAFHSLNWGELILQKLAEPSCGVIGFAGSTIKSKVESPLRQIAKFSYSNYIQDFSSKQRLFFNNINPDKDYEPCIILDGFCLFARKDVWIKNPFDEELLPGFHGYDLDFSLQVAQSYSNYICNTIVIEHFSLGGYNKDWVEATIKMHQQKWENKLPLYIGNPTAKEIQRNEDYMYFIFVKYAIKSNYSFCKVLKLVGRYIIENRGKKYSLTLIGKLFVKRIFLFKF